MITNSTIITVTRPNWLKSEYQFVLNDKIVGLAKLDRKIKAGATATLFDQSWAIHQTGFWKSVFEYKSEHRPFTKGKLSASFGGKVSWTSSDGKTYTFKKLKWYSSSWAWFDESRQPLIEFKPVYSFSKKNAMITVAEPRHPDYVFLIFVGWFSMILQQRNAAAAAA